MHGTLTIARLTWLEARRRRIVVAAVVAGLLFLLLYGIAVGFIVKSAPAAPGNLPFRPEFLILAQAGLYVATFLSYAVAILLPIDTLSGEIDSGVMQTLAAKPISRAAIVLGKTLTYWLMAVAYLLLMAGGIIVIVRIWAGFVPTNLPRALPIMMLGTSVPLVASIAGGAQLKTITNGIVAFGYYGLAFLGGWIEQIGAAVGSDPARHIGTAISLVSPSDAMWRRAAYEMQPDFMRSFVGFSPFGAISLPSDAMIVWTLGVVIVLVALGLWLFHRRAL